MDNFLRKMKKLYFVFQVKLLLIIAVAIDDMNATFTCILKQSLQELPVSYIYGLFELGTEQ